MIGRQQEIKLIQDCLKSSQAEMGIVYGRRRIGKSFLLKSFVKTKNDLYFEGLEGLSTEKQISHFTDQLAKQTKTAKISASSWKVVFDELTRYMVKGKRFVVFDELPWMACENSELIAIIKYYWDGFWKNNPKLTFVLCGSVANFMVKHVLHSKSLHNRKTFEIHLDTLPANESKIFFKNYRSNFETLKFLMIFGGVPKYLEQINPKKSLSENLDALCFTRNGFFVNEFATIFKEQFKVIKNYQNIVARLAKGSCTREDLAQSLKMDSGGGLNTYLDNLESAGFVKTFHPYTADKIKSKTKRMYLWDEWLHFYFLYMSNIHAVIELNSKPGLAEKTIGPRLPLYLGKAFERHCIKNLPLILESMGSSIQDIKGFGPYFKQGSRKTNTQGVQIDILAEKRGKILTVFECKFHAEPIGVSVIDDFKRKLSVLQVPRNYSLERVLIAPSGATNDLVASEYFHKILGLEAVM